MPIEDEPTLFVSHLWQKVCSRLSAPFAYRIVFGGFFDPRAVYQGLLAQLELTKRLVVRFDLWYFLHPL